ncbi:uncharacterized protein LOC128390835 [Panonychus citri]|uniref:uncharacterized protein LOC128390835 n=1 Tax=Panonychus citri TaxID=50023 RepID=UPI002307DEA3|nr:uncharacterized protein LOC128390835 [Panonychus citri]
MDEQLFRCRSCPAVFDDLSDFINHSCCDNDELNDLNIYLSSDLFHESSIAPPPPKPLSPSSCHSLPVQPPSPPLASTSTFISSNQLETSEDLESINELIGKCNNCNLFIESFIDLLNHNCDLTGPSTSESIEDVTMNIDNLCCPKCNMIFSSIETQQNHIKVCGLTISPVVQTNVVELFNFLLTKKAFRSKYRLYSRQFDKCYTLEDLQKTTQPDIKLLIKEVSEELGPLKISFSINIVFEKLGTKEFITSYIHSIFKIYLSECDDLTQLLSDSFAEIQSIIDHYTERGSGFIIVCISALDVYIASYQPHHGGCKLQKLPPQLTTKKCFVTLNCNTSCFMYAILASIYGVSDKHRTSKYRKYLRAHNFSKWIGDVSLDQINGFEKANEISVSVFSYNLEGKYIIPLRITTEKKKNHVKLLLYADHYYPISNLRRALNSRTNRRRYHCERCLHGYDRAEKLATHLVDCENRAVQRVKIPLLTREDPLVNIVKRNLKKESKHPFVIYADFESVCIPTGDSRKVSRHEPSSYGYIVVDWNKKVIKSDFKHGKDIINDFLSSIKHTEKWLTVYLKENASKPLAITDDIEESFSLASNCWICDGSLGGDKVRDHDHFTGKYRGAAHNICNINYAIPKRIPIFFHNLKNYDSHLLITGMDSKTFSTNITIIPQTMEKYIGWFVGNLAFLDSYAFLPASLDTLSKDLSLYEKETFLRQEWKSCDLTDLLDKAALPYEYLDSFDRYNEQQLPKIESFYSSLTDKNISIEMYERLQRVWKQFNCENLADLIDIYLRLDVYLLAAVFENFRETSLNDFGIDPPHYMSVPGLSFASAIKMLKVSLKIFTDLEMYMMIENGIRGGFTTVAKRHVKANNRLLKSYDGGEQTWLLYLDVNNLYGKAMCDVLPIGNYKWTKPCDLEFFLTIHDEAETGYILEVDLLYPETLHNLHNDFPLAPHKLVISDEMLSPTAKKILKQLEQRSTKTEKLVATFLPRTRYVIHYRTLKYYIAKGMQVTTIHRAISFNQKRWLSPYVNLCTEKRKRASSPFVSSLYKLFVNSNYGKLMEDKRKRVKVDLVTSDAMAARRARKHLCKNMRILAEDKVLFQMLPDTVVLDKPIIVGFTVLELAKLHVYQLYYDRFKSFYGDKICLVYSDTDSLLVEIKTEDLVSDMKFFSDIMDFSDLPIDHCLYSAVNKKKIGCLKDEMSGQVIEEVVALRPKLYAIKTENEVKKRAKGVQGVVVKNQLTFDDYKNTLFDVKTVRKSTRRLGSENHIIHLYVDEKIALSPFEDKRYLTDSVNSLAYGHYSINQ